MSSIYAKLHILGIKCICFLMICASFSGAWKLPMASSPFAKAYQIQVCNRLPAISHHRRFHRSPYIIKGQKMSSSNIGGPEAQSRLEKLRKGMMRLQKNGMPVTREDVERYSQVINSVVSSVPSEVPLQLAAHAQFLLSQNLIDLSFQFRQSCRAEDAETIDDAEAYVVAFLEEFVSQVSSMGEDSRALLREIVQASRQGMQALNAKIKHVVSGEDHRYTAEFIRFLDEEIARLHAAEAKQPRAASRFVGQRSVELDVPTNLDQQDDDDEEDEEAVPDARAAASMLAMIKVRLNAEMEEGLGEDSAPAKILSRLLQVDELPLRAVAIHSALSEMPHDTLDDVQDMVKKGEHVDGELITRLTDICETTKRYLRLA